MPASYTKSMHSTSLASSWESSLHTRCWAGRAPKQRKKSGSPCQKAIRGGRSEGGGRREAGGGRREAGRGRWEEAGSAIDRGSTTKDVQSGTLSLGFPPPASRPPPPPSPFPVPPYVFH